MTGLYYTHIDSPVGPLLAAGDGQALHFLSFSTGRKAFGPRPDWRFSDAPFVEVRRQLDAYFSGDLRQFDLRLCLSGTDFQNSVWRYLSDIPFGKTQSYGQLATALGRPKASRAVGAANGNNPLPIILPCHRVIGANGALTGFGGGLATKDFLLRHEGVYDHENNQLNLFKG
jgi:methylated-DNA-[protein]-cysteine S-methyltransferase